MDTFVTVVFIIIAILSVISNARKQAAGKTGRAAKARPSTGLITRLNEAFAELRKKMEARARQAKQTRDGHSQWDLLIESDAEAVAPEESSPVVEDLPEPPSRKPPAPPRASRAAEKPPKEAEKTVAPIPAPKQRAARKPGIVLNRAQLRKAVIWSEIIGPPVALRDRSGD